jgi:K+-sensing histidine kinase KdpD
VNASKIIIASDDIARGLVQLVDQHGVTELVMGAASDRAYSRYGIYGHCSDLRHI